MGSKPPLPWEMGVDDVIGKGLDVSSVIEPSLLFFGERSTASANDLDKSWGPLFIPVFDSLIVIDVKDTGIVYFLLPGVQDN